jgi:hypothetical protein
MDSPYLTNHASMIIMRNHTTISAKRNLTFLQPEVVGMEEHQEPSVATAPNHEAWLGNHPPAPLQRTSHCQNHRIRRTRPPHQQILPNPNDLRARRPKKHPADLAIHPSVYIFSNIYILKRIIH